MSGAAARELAGGVRSVGFSGLAGLRERESLWRDLHARSAADALCNDYDWLSAHAEAFSDPLRLFGLEVRDAADRPIGLAVFQPEPSRGPVSLPRLVLLGDGSFDSDYLEPLSLRGREPEVARAVLDAMDRERRFGALVLSHVCAASPFLAAIESELADRGAFVQVHPFEAGIAELAGDFEAFVAGLKPRMRSKVRQAVRKAEARGGTIEWLDDRAQTEAWCEELFRLHTERWRARGEPGSFADPRRRTFYARLLPPFLTRGSLAFSRLLREGRPVAYQLGFHLGDCYYQLQEGYEPELESERPGVALRALSIRDLIRRGVRRYDFLEGYTQHKRDWGAVLRPGRTIAFATGSLRGRLAYWARAQRSRLRG